MNPAELFDQCCSDIEAAYGRLEHRFGWRFLTVLGPHSSRIRKFFWLLCSPLAIVIGFPNCLGILKNAVLHTSSKIGVVALDVIHYSSKCKCFLTRWRRALACVLEDNSWRKA
jgi:hypothetical protein